MVTVRCKDPVADKHDWEVWPIDPEKYDVDGVAVPIGPKSIYRTDDYYYAEEAYWNEHLKHLAVGRRISFNGFRSNLKHRRLDDQRLGENKAGRDMKGFLADLKKSAEVA